MKRHFSRWRVAGSVAVLVWFLPMSLAGQQVYPMAPYTAAPTQGGVLRNATRATHSQAIQVRNTAREWSRRANAGAYPTQYVREDWQKLSSEFEALRGQFNGLASLVAQQEKPQTSADALADLGAGLEIISQTFAGVQEQLRAGLFDRNAIARMCQTVDKAVAEWDQEFTKRTARLNFVW